MCSTRRLARGLLVAAAVGVSAQCTKLPYEPVQIVVVDVATVGSEVDTDGYVLHVGDVMSRSVESNGSATFEGLGAGEYLLRVDGVAGNCALDGLNPRPLSVKEDTITREELTVTCGPPTGSLTVDVTTTGTEVDPDGYTVSVDGTLTQLIPSNGSVTFEDLAPGDHVVRLTNVAENCRVTTDPVPNPRTVSVVSDASVATAFSVYCGPLAGDLVVVVATSGTEVDPDGYTLSVDGSSPKPIDNNGSVVFSGLTPGEHTVTIGGLAENCSLTDGADSRTVTLAAGTSAAVAFFVNCGPPTGALVVAVTTTGTDVDADGYTVTLNDEDPRAVSTNGSATFEGLADGDYTVELSGIAANCAVLVDENPNPRTVTVTSGASATTIFFVHCEPVAGAVVVDVTTTGTGVDPDGYTVSLDGLATKPIATNGAVAFEDVAAGPHAVTLGDLENGCFVQESARRQFMVSPGASTRVSLAVVCGGTPPPGALRVDVMTTGEEPDPDGYTLSVDGGTPRPVSTNGSVEFEGLSVGEHTVDIDDLAENCSVTDGSRSRTVTVTADETAVLSFSVNCRGTGDTGTLQVRITTTGEDPDPDGYTLSVDGGTPRPAPTNGSVEFEGLSVGEHTVRISDLAKNCSVAGGFQYRTVTVPAEGSAVLSFSVECQAIPDTGTLQVKLITSGEDLDPDGYTLSVDGGTPQPAPTNGSIKFFGLSVGDHTVRIAGLAANCSLSWQKPVEDFTVTAGELSIVWFFVECTAPAGALAVKG